MVSYKQLRNGTWGVRSLTPINPGDVVTVTRKDGSTRQVTIARVLWTDGATWIASLAEPSYVRRRTAPRPASRPPRPIPPADLDDRTPDSHDPIDAIGF